jgi:hypothetical protein
LVVLNEDEAGVAYTLRCFFPRQVVLRPDYPSSTAPFTFPANARSKVTN